MPLISRDAMRDIAKRVRPHITPFLEREGGISNDDLKKLIKEHTGRLIVSKRTLDIIQEELCEV
jgi:hypothetical protein